MKLITSFENNLLKLNPEMDEFVFEADELIQTIAVELHEQLIPSIFRFFEANTLSDRGSPGSLVHLIESYYPNYLDMLIESVSRKPSYNTILMINRILNSQLSNELRKQLLQTLESVKNNTGISPELNNQANEFIEFQNQ